MPNRKIIDYASGFRGSRHDTYCFASTKLGKHPLQYLEKDEWCWADVSYPLQKGVMIPYKSSAASLKPNQIFKHSPLSNSYLVGTYSTIGYLKGRFQCLKKLCFQVLNAQDLAYVALWINTCIILHAFCLDHELEIETNRLKDGMHWEKEQNKDIEREQEAENMPTGRRSFDCGEKRIVREHKKHQLLCGLRNGTYLLKDFLY